ncbi:hypothetical protein FY036_15285 [Mesorhizobium microcysteis]|uniref:Uncharacterized protein n=1 Tax=Neoaquamicrobium microcysteis TaxID=2682781 RepID=A0A5D4GS97_9HYPH|nr:hypothetical protein [Mesorhizobium microcysteis]TYR31626.1 hypothetical protein FY036_15285 [Mesorhizobium microcysteis]
MDNTVNDAGSKSLGLAALFICQSLLLELEEAGLVGHDNIQGLLKDAFNALRQDHGGARRAEWIEASEVVDAIRIRHDRLGSRRRS